MTVKRTLTGGSQLHLQFGLITRKWRKRMKGRKTVRKMRMTGRKWKVGYRSVLAVII